MLHKTVQKRGARNNFHGNARECVYKCHGRVNEDNPSKGQQIIVLVLGEGIFETYSLGNV